MERIYFDRQSEWKTQEGKYIKICDLTESHLFHLLMYVELRCEYHKLFKMMGDGESLVRLLKEEIEYRKLTSKFEKQFDRDLWATVAVVEKITPSVKSVCKLMNQYPVEQSVIDEIIQKQKAK